MTNSYRIHAIATQQLEAVLTAAERALDSLNQKVQKRIWTTVASFRVCMSGLLKSRAPSSQDEQMPWQNIVSELQDLSDASLAGVPAHVRTAVQSAMGVLRRTVLSQLGLPKPTRPSEKGRRRFREGDPLPMRNSNIEKARQLLRAGDHAGAYQSVGNLLKLSREMKRCPQDVYEALVIYSKCAQALGIVHEWEEHVDSLVNAGVLNDIQRTDLRGVLERQRDDIEAVASPRAYKTSTPVGERAVRPKPINAVAARVLHNMEIRSKAESRKLP